MNIGSLFSLLFPPECLSCQARVPAGVLCAACRASIRVSVTPPRFIGAAARYATPAIQDLIHALKFRGIRAAAEPIADVLIHYAEALPLMVRGYVVIPVPLSRERRRERGFNQAELIAAPFAAYFGIPLVNDALVRAAHRKPQSETASVAERRENIRGVFTADAVLIRAREIKNVILIDDVTTSGSTFLEAAGTLRAAGVGNIIALAAARV